jgi:protocatechuate 3,4-dioxygenase beta subunit
MNKTNKILTSRREVLQSAGRLTLYMGLASPAILTSRKSLAQQPVTPGCGGQTPPQLEGPFFTPLSPERNTLIDPDMTAPRIKLIGEVMDSACRLVPGALLDFWQCDDKGRYDNRGYRLRGHQYTNNKGQFLLETLIPGEYPGRTPHLHVKVQRKNGPALTTQLYLPDHPRNRRDFLYDPRLIMVPRGAEFYFRFVLPA